MIFTPSLTLLFADLEYGHGTLVLMYDQYPAPKIYHIHVTTENLIGSNYYIFDPYFYYDMQINDIHTNWENHRILEQHIIIIIILTIILLKTNYYFLVL